MWSSALGSSPDCGERRDFAQVLSQVNFYMKQHEARYGFVLTDRELVAIRRVDGREKIELSAPVYWDTRGTADQPRLTIMTAL
jgi:hypothetical protein